MATSVELSPEVQKRLAELARQTNRSPEFHLQEVIEYGLADVEDYYRAFRDHNGEGRTYTLEEVRKHSTWTIESLESASRVPRALAAPLVVL